MMVGWWIRGAVLATLMVATAGPVSGQDKKKGGDSSGGYSAIIDNIDMLVENYAKFLGRKYDLNDEQFGFTKQMLRDKVYGFLDKNETDVRDLFDQMFQARTAGTMSQDGLIDWGKRVGPIYEEAKKIIESANGEWRETLNDQQRAIHDEDLKLMKQSFDETDEKLTRIQRGEMSIEEFVKPSGGRPKRPRPTPTPAQNPENAEHAATGDARTHTTQSFIKPNPAVQKAQGADATPLSPVPPDGQAPPQDPSQNQVVQPAGEAQGGEQPQPEPEHVDPGAATHQPPQPDRNARPNRQVQPKGAGKNFESEWEKYVRDFIQKYQLNDEQTQRANAILADCEAQAERQLASKKSELERIEKREGELKGAAAAPAAGAKGAAPDAKAAAEAKSKETAELTKKRDEILAPINRIFEDQLKPKLEKLPTRAQRKAADEAAAKKGPAKAADKAPAKDAKSAPAKDEKKP